MPSESIAGTAQIRCVFWGFWGVFFYLLQRVGVEVLGVDPEQPERGPDAVGRVAVVAEPLHRGVDVIADGIEKVGHLDRQPLLPRELGQPGGGGGCSHRILDTLIAVPEVGPQIGHSIGFHAPIKHPISMGTK